MPENITQTPGHVWVLRVHWHQHKRPVWVMCNRAYTKVGLQRETLPQLLKRWQETHGEVGAITKIVGTCSPAEAAMEISEKKRS